jgi:hypothetical protein
MARAATKKRARTKPKDRNKKKKRARKQARQPQQQPVARLGHTVSQWTRAYGMSRQHFYDLEERGEAPATLKSGKLRIITDQADRDWREAREAATAA